MSSHNFGSALFHVGDHDGAWKELEKASMEVWHARLVHDAVEDEARGNLKETVAGKNEAVAEKTKTELLGGRGSQVSSAAAQHKALTTAKKVSICAAFYQEKNWCGLATLE